MEKTADSIRFVMVSDCQTDIRHFQTKSATIALFVIKDGCNL